MRLPAWIQKLELKNTYKVHVDEAYSEWLGLLGLDRNHLDRYWYEVIFQCVKFDAMLALEDAELHTDGSAVTFVFSSCDNTWNIAALPHGLGADEAVKRQAARDVYLRIRGRLPARVTGTAS